MGRGLDPDVTDLSTLASMPDDELSRLATESPREFQDTLEAIATYLREWQLTYYTVANPDALRVHTSLAREICISGGNRSGKSDTMLAELAIQMTGHVPDSLVSIYPKEKLRGPIRARVVCNSLTDTLEPILKPKLRFDQWNGTDETRGHWGWIPRHLLKDGKWEGSYSEKYRTLTVHHTGGGTSTCQFLSYDQDLSAFAGASMHFVGHDELPPQDIYRENRTRTLDVRGRIYTAFTPPDEPGANRSNVMWFFEQIYERGLPGPAKSPMIDTIMLFTERNRVLRPQDVADFASTLTEEQKAARLYGRFVHLSGVVYPLFTPYTAHWCFRCARRVVPVDGHCQCGDDTTEFSHVIEPYSVPKNWPVVFVLDPHPRKADACGWFAVTPSDDVVLIRELEVSGTAKEVVKAIRDVEDQLGMTVVKRLMDPNIATETNDKLGRGWTLRRAYDDEGLRCDMANDEMNAGIYEVTMALQPDVYTKCPRFQVFANCEKFIYGMTHWAWDEWVRGGDREPKEKTRDQAKDFPDLVRYLFMDKPSFRGYQMSGVRHSTHGRSERGY
jgi:phage terminase large subunit-like protein